MINIKHKIRRYKSMKNDFTDLIDRKALLKKWDEKFFAMGADRLGANGDEIMWYINSLLDEIKNAPIVDLGDVEYKAFCEGVDKMKEEIMKGDTE